jgi:hypothetical protein
MNALTKTRSMPAALLRGPIALWYRVINRFRPIAELRFLPVLAGIGSFVAFVTVTIEPMIRQEGINVLKSDGFLRLCWTYGYLFLAALYLKYKDSIATKLQTDEKKRVAWKSRKILAALAIQKLEPKVPKNTQLMDIRREVLTCVASSVAEMLDLPRALFCANLLEFTSSKFDEMEVVMRSQTHRSSSMPKHPVTPEFGPWRAIDEGRCVLVDDARSDSRWPKNPRPPYRSILILPITKNNKACGALTIDCTKAYVYALNGLNIEILVQPYIALLSLTFGTNNVWKECKYSPPRH